MIVRGLDSPLDCSTLEQLMGLRVAVPVTLAVTVNCASAPVRVVAAIGPACDVIDTSGTAAGAVSTTEHKADSIDTAAIQRVRCNPAAIAMSSDLTAVRLMLFMSACSVCGGGVNNRQCCKQARKGAGCL